MRTGGLLLKCLIIILLSSSCFALAASASKLSANALQHVDQTTETQEKRLWNLENADIRAVIAAVSQVTGKNFLVDPSVQGKITLVSSTPISADAVYQMFLSALQVLGYQAIPAGNLVKIVPASSARAQGAPLASQVNPGQGDEPVVRVVQVKNLPVSQLVPLLRPLLPDWATLNAYPPSNSMVIAGNADSVNKIVAMIHNMDTKAASVTRVFHLQYANAEQVNQVLSNLQSAERASGKISNVSIAADKSNNNIILNGSKQDLQSYLTLLAQLDKRATQSTTQVIYLNYLNAKKFAPILAKIAGAKDVTGGAALSTAGKLGSSQGNDSVSDSSAQANNDDTGTAGGSGNGVTIQAEPNTNSIIINAPPLMMSNIKAVVAKLDHRPKQVLVEAVIAQVDQSVLNQLGIQWGTIAEGGSIISFNSTSAQNFNQGIGIAKSESLRAIINFLQTDTQTNILSTPSLVVLDNQKASIEVGKTVSIETGSYSGTGASDESGNPNPFNTFDRKKIALVLSVTPQISPDQTVRLLIDQKNDTLENPNDPGTQPVVNNAEIKTNVMVKSGNILVLGGLISNDNQKQIQKVPVLGDIPLLGRLFRYDRKTVDKKNLMIFLRPIILEGGQTAKTAKLNEVSEDRYNYIRGKQADTHLQKNLNSLLHESAVLPAYQKESIALPIPTFRSHHE